MIICQNIGRNVVFKDMKKTIVGQNTLNYLKNERVTKDLKKKGQEKNWNKEKNEVKENDLRKKKHELVARGKINSKRDKQGNIGKEKDIQSKNQFEDL